MSVFIKPASVKLFRFRALVVVALCAALLSLPATGVKGDDQIIEEGKFRIYETRHVQGTETYKITREGDDLILTASLDLSPLDVEGPLAASLRMRRDLTPRQFTIKGTKASGDKVDLSVVIEGPSATVREGEQTRKAEHVNNIGVPPEAEEPYRQAFEQFVAMVGALHKAGVPIFAGTDVVVPGHSLHRELELFVKAGLTPMEAIQAASVVPARAMNRDKDVGTLEAGKRADIIIVDANPLESISNIRRLRWVIARGRMFDSDKLWQAAGF